MGVETELFGIKNRPEGQEFKIIERADGNLAVMAGDKVLVDSGVTPVTSTLPSGTYSCDVGTRTWTGTIKPAILTLTPGAGGTAYVEATEDGSTWVVWSEGVVSVATTARLAGPVVGLRVVSTVAASSLGVVA